MTIFNTEPDKSIYALDKYTQSSKFYLKWKASGHTAYLILFGENNKAVDLTLPENQKLCDALLSRETIAVLKEEKTEVFPQDKLQLFFLTHNDLMRDGGMQLKEKPGVYAVYGLSLANENEPVVYLNDDGGNHMHMYTMLLEVIIEQKPYFIEKKKLFKKETVYSGYREIKLQKPYPGLVGGILKYKINDYKFPFPDGVVRNGGAFYVKADQNSVIVFDTGNPGIRIK